MLQISKIFFVHFIISNQITLSQILSKVFNDLQICDSNILTVTSGDTFNDAFYGVRRSKEISYLRNDDFLNAKFSHLKHNMPSCSVIFVSANDTKPDNLSRLVQKTRDDILSLSLNDWKPTAVFVWTEFPSSFQANKTFELNTLQALFKITGLNFDIDSNVYAIFISSGSGTIDRKLDYYSIWEIYSLKSKLFFQKLKQSYGSQLQIFSQPDVDEFQSVSKKAVRRSNFRKENIVASIRQGQPDWMRFVNNTIGERQLTGGFSVNLYWDLQKILNFSIETVIGDGLKTLENNTLGGQTVSQLDSGEADISLSQSSLVPFRARQLTFLQPSYYGIINIFFKQPSASSIRNIVTAPFDTYLWMSLIGTWIILIIVVKISSNLKRFYLRESKQENRDSARIDESGYGGGAGNSTMPEETQEFSEYDTDTDIQFSNQIGMWTFAANCQKSWHIIPNSVSMRMIFIIGIFCGVVSYVAYSGQIVSTLAVNIIPVKQIMDLIHFKYKFTVHESSEPFHIFLKEMINFYKLEQKVLKISTQEEINHLLKQDKAFLTYPDLFYRAAVSQLNYKETFICQHVSQVRVSDFPYRSGMFLKKGSELAEIFNHKLIILKERGLNYRYMQQYEQRNIVSCLQQEQTTFNPVAFTDVFSAFLVIIIGLLGSFLFVCLEIIFRSRKIRKEST